MGKSYTNYKQARSNFMRSAFEKVAGQTFSNFSGKKKKQTKSKKSIVLSGMAKPLSVNIEVDATQLQEALAKLAASMSKSARIVSRAMVGAMLTGASVSFQFNGQMSVVEACLNYEKRRLVLQHLGWIQDPEGGLVSPNTLDIVDPAILDDGVEFDRFLNYYLATSKVGEWVPCLYAVPQIEKIALPLDSVRKQLEERISE